jgi:hypothetical protein
VEADAREYWEGVSNDDKQARLVGVMAGHWQVVRTMLDSFNQSFTMESAIRGPFEAAFRSGHNAAVVGASDAHAEIWSDTTDLDGEPPIGNGDLLFVYNNKLTGIIELKTWWKVNPGQIDDVKAGTWKL